MAGLVDGTDQQHLGFVVIIDTDDIAISQLLLTGLVPMHYKSLEVLVYKPRA
jgi:hypothetical protein